MSNQRESNFARKKLVPMEKQSARDHRMYNISEGINLKGEDSFKR